MTYRDTEDALRARIQALESKLAQRAQERSELQQELGAARQDLAAMQQEQEPPRPRVLLALGVIGASLTVVAMVALNWLRVVGYAPWLFTLTYGAADLGLGLGMLGFYRVTRQRLALAAAILLLLGPLDSLFHFALASTLGLGFNYYSWLKALALGVVQGLALVRAPGRYLRPWKRNLTGVLCFVTVFLGAISFAFFLRMQADTSTEVLENTLRIVRYISYPSTVAYLAKNVSLMLCFLELRRLTGAAPKAS